VFLEGTYIIDTALNQKFVETSQTFFEMKDESDHKIRAVENIKNYSWE